MMIVCNDAAVVVVISHGAVRCGRIFGSVCLSVCPQHNSEMSDPKVFKLGTGNDLGIS